MIRNFRKDLEYCNITKDVVEVRVRLLDPCSQSLFVVVGVLNCVLPRMW